MTRNQLPAWVLALAALAASGAAAGPGDEAETGVRPEPEVALPPYPKDQGLFVLDEPPRTGMRYLIDTASISVGEDRVVRYTAVVRTPGGAVNVTYEGINCATIEKRVYASGQQGNTWVRSRETAWGRIGKTRQDHHRFLLYDQYFCAFNLPVQTPDEAMRALRNGGNDEYIRNRIHDLTF